MGSPKDKVITEFDKSDWSLDQLVLTKICRMGFDAISLISVTTKMYKFRDMKKRPEKGVDNSSGDYDTKMKEHLLQILVTDGNIEDTLHLFSLETIKSALKEKESYSIHYKVKNEQNKIRYKRTEFCYLDEEQKIILCCRQDITESFIRTNEQIHLTGEALKNTREADREKSIFLSKINYDLRTSLNDMIEFSRKIEETDDLELVRQLSGKILSSGAYLQTIINDTVGLSRIESGKAELNPEPSIYSEFEPSIRGVLEVNANSKGVNLSFVPPKEQPMSVMLDQIILQQVLFHLINKAIKHTNPGGDVTVQTDLLDQTNEGERIRFTVRDTGTGIREDFMPYLFEPFARERRKEEAENRTGLGLAVMKDLVDMMDGTIDCESEFGKGTTFTIEIPAKAAQMQIDAFKYADKVFK